MEREVKKKVKKKGKKKCKSDSHFSSFSFLLHFHFLVASYPLLYLFQSCIFFRFLIFFHCSSFKCTSINSFPHNFHFFSLLIPRKRKYYQTLFARIDKITSSIFIQLSRVRKYSFLFLPKSESQKNHSRSISLYTVIYITIIFRNLFHFCVMHSQETGMEDKEKNVMKKER